VTTFPLEKTGEAMDELRHGRLVGAAVISLIPA
jgi:hypothetical protein